MPQAKADKERAKFFLTEEAAQLLTQLAPTEMWGQYVSRLIVQVAQQAGLIPGEANSLGEPDVLKQLAELRTRLTELEDWLGGAGLAVLLSDAKAALPESEADFMGIERVGELNSRMR
ncbi:MAG: hypothetical protein ACR2M0_05850 [Chloroflexia bacterium]